MAQRVLRKHSKTDIVDPAEEKGEIRILNLADQMTTVLPIGDWKWQLLTYVSWSADGKSWFVLAQSAFVAGRVDR